jgi:hypothetical protein
MLPQQPLAPPPLQHALTERLLLAQQECLLAFFKQVRRDADQTLRVQQPTKGGKPYPLGQCLEICQRVFSLLQAGLQAPAPLALSPTEQQGLDCLRGFFAAGGQLRMVWGALRGQYFQNAMQLGSLYVDVANDTVFSDKPPVELLPFQDCGLVAIRDFFHFADIARRYWRGELYPNHVFPHLAPYFPWISVVPGTGVQLEAGNNYMIALTRQDGFRSAQHVLEQAAPPTVLCDAIAAMCTGASLGFTPAGQAAALTCCVSLRQNPPTEAQRDQCVIQLLAINQLLARIGVGKGLGANRAYVL